MPRGNPYFVPIVLTFLRYYVTIHSVLVRKFRRYNERRHPMSRTRKLPDNAFYFDDRYFLLPEDCSDIAELEEKHRDGKPFPVS